MRTAVYSGKDDNALNPATYTEDYVQNKILNKISLPHIYYDTQLLSTVLSKNPTLINGDGKSSMLHDIMPFTSKHNQDYYNKGFAPDLISHLIESIKVILSVAANGGTNAQEYVNKQNITSNSTALHLAASYSQNAEIIKLLIDYGANLDIENEHAATPLGTYIHARGNQPHNQEIVKLLSR